MNSVCKLIMIVCTSLYYVILFTSSLLSDFNLFSKYTCRQLLWSPHLKPSLLILCLTLATIWVFIEARVKFACFMNRWGHHWRCFRMFKVTVINVCCHGDSKAYCRRCDIDECTFSIFFFGPNCVFNLTNIVLRK